MPRPLIIRRILGVGLESIVSRSIKPEIQQCTPRDEMHSNENKNVAGG